MGAPASCFWSWSGVSEVATGDALVVDIRDGAEIGASGKVAGAIAVSRGTLEFRATGFHTRATPPPLGRSATTATR